MKVMTCVSCVQNSGYMCACSLSEAGGERKQCLLTLFVVSECGEGSDEEEEGDRERGKGRGERERKREREMSEVYSMLFFYSLVVTHSFCVSLSTISIKTHTYTSFNHFPNYLFSLHYRSLNASSKFRQQRRWTPTQRREK